MNVFSKETVFGHNVLAVAAYSSSCMLFIIYSAYSMSFVTIVAIGRIYCIVFCQL